MGVEENKGRPELRDAHDLIAEAAPRGEFDFVGFVEGGDIPSSRVDVVVTDGFTGNVALKTLEGGMRALVGGVLGSFDTDEATRAAAEVLMPALAPLYAQLDPENVGGAMLLGVDGVCIISHGSSSATAMANAIGVAHDLVVGQVVDHLRAATAPAP